MAIYTKRGDDGTTSLAGGRRVSKADPRVEAYGTVDEVDTFLGLAASLLGDEAARAVDLPTVQNHLMTACADLAFADGDGAAPAGRTALASEAVEGLEALIDRLEADLPPLRSFILPGGSPGAAALFACATLCRRAERKVVALAQDESVSGTVLAYLNRLSDALFVAARWVNHREGGEETPWSVPRS